MGGLNSAVSFRKRQIQSKPLLVFFNCKRLEKLAQLSWLLLLLVLLLVQKKIFSTYFCDKKLLQVQVELKREHCILLKRHGNRKGQLK